MSDPIPQANINFEAYLDGKRLIGIVGVTNPTISTVTAEVKGAGISGVVDQPIYGQIQAMSGTLEFRTITEDLNKLMGFGRLHLEFWNAVQGIDSSNGAYDVGQHKIIWGASFKNGNPGNLNPGEGQGRSVEFEVTYFKEIFKGKEKYEIDKFNNIFRVNGVDLLSKVKQAIGLM